MNSGLKHTMWFGLVLLLAGTLSATPVSAAAGFDPAFQPTGYVVPPVLTSYDVSSGNETSYQGTFDKEFWYGNIHAYPISSTGVIDYAAERWPGGAMYFLSLQDFDSGRLIVTRSNGSSVPFRWGSLSAAQQTALGSEDMLNYVRGDRSNENAGLNLRVRKSVLGDIMHSRPYMHDGLLYIGANDGMVHVINANNAAASALGVTEGGEVYAYIPSLLIPKLPNLAVDPYVHTYFVDGPMGFDIATIDCVTRKMLVGTLGAGGKGLYALDVTTPVPASFAESQVVNNVRWEKSNADAGYANLGYTYSTPQIVRVNKADGGDSTITAPAVIIGNGYVNTGNGHATLLVINLADGSVIREIDTTNAGDTSGVYGSAGAPSGLSSPTVVDINADSVVDYVFAGDIDGRLWKFDLTATNPANWTKTLVYTATGKSITVAPSISRIPGATTTSSTASEPAMYTCLGDHRSPDSCAGVPGTLPQAYGAPEAPPYAQVCNYNCSTNTTSCSVSYRCPGDHRSPDSCMNVLTPSYTVPGMPHAWAENCTYSGTSTTCVFSTPPVTSTTTVPNLLVNFATGRMLTPADAADAVTVNSAYGIAVPAAGSTIQTQVLSAGTFVRTDVTPNVTTQVRTGTVNPVDLSSALGWRTDLPAGERVVGDGSFVASGRYYFMSTNPTVPHPDLPAVPPSTTATKVPQGDSWLIELDYKTGGGSITPFLDLSGDLALSDSDRLRTSYPSGSLITGAAGVPCAKYTGAGINSQPVLTNLIVLNTALFNSHPDMVAPLPPGNRGVSGGHFDFDINYPSCTATGWTPVGTYPCTGNQTSCRNVPAGNYTVPIGYDDDCTVSSTAGATHTCLGKKAIGGCQAFSDPPYTLPAGTTESCTQASAVWATKPTCLGNHTTGSGCVSFSPTPAYTLGPDSTQNCVAATVTDATYTCAGDHDPGTCSGHVPAPSPSAYTVPVGSTETCVAAQAGTYAGTNYCAPGGTNTCIGKPGFSATYTNVFPVVDAVESCSDTGSGSTRRKRCRIYPVTTTCTIRTLRTTCTVTNWTTTCPSTVWTTSCVLSKPTYTCSWGNATASTGTSVSDPHQINVHVHEYDDIYDRTGVDMLNPCDTSMDIKNAVVDSTTPFKVLVVNAAYSPSASLMLGGGTYQKVIDYDNHFADLSLLPTYTRTSVNSFKVNLPVTAFTSMDWGTGDVRTGLMPLKYACVWKDVFTSCDGTKRSCPGTSGEWRNGSLTFQVIKDTTPSSALEINVTGQPDLGYRVKRAERNNYLLAEYTIWWHHPNDRCMASTGWTKSPPQDLAASDATPQDGAAGCTDPKIGSFGTDGSNILSIVTTLAPGVMTTVTTFLDGTTETVVRTHNSNNTYTITTTDVMGNVTEITTPNLEGSVDRSGEESGSAGVGRFSWRELGN